mmetsp:Transcript_16964/g.35205  ORF Transcript_16964/g.35205 Transcript_16964/m.35205 type:complete len:255 (-) Transcript_16964:344-1108(-)
MLFSSGEMDIPVAFGVMAYATAVGTSSFAPIRRGYCAVGKPKVGRWVCIPTRRGKNAPGRTMTPQWVAISSNDIRPGTTIVLDGSVHRVLEFLHVKPGKGAAFVRSKLRNLETGNSVEKTFRAGETLVTAVLDRMTMQHTYKDGDEFVFMNMETFEEERLTEMQLGLSAKYIKEGLDVEVLKHEGRVLDCEIPKTMVLQVVETDPGVKGNTVQGGSKPATLETGAIINVPLFIETGEQIKVDTRENKYLGRSNE